MISCEKCGAVCPEKKDEKRFQRRHPKKCQSHAAFQHALAADTVSVDYDEAEKICGTCMEPHVSGVYKNHNFVTTESEDETGDQEERR